MLTIGGYLLAAALVLALAGACGTIRRQRERIEYHRTMAEAYLREGKKYQEQAARWSRILMLHSPQQYVVELRAINDQRRREAERN